MHQGQRAEGRGRPGRPTHRGQWCVGAGRGGRAWRGLRMLYRPQWALCCARNRDCQRGVREGVAEAKAVPQPLGAADGSARGRDDGLGWGVMSAR